MALLGLVLGLTGSGLIAGSILAANMLAPLFVFPLVSIVVDRLDRRWLMIGADLLAAGMGATMMLVDSVGTIWIGIAAAFGIATMEAFSRPAAQAALPNLVCVEDLGHANALLASVQGIALGIGSLVGGATAAYVGHDVVFGTNALSFVLSARLVLKIGLRFAEDCRKLPLSRSVDVLREGIAFTRASPRVGALLLMKSAFALAGGGAFVLLPIFAFEIFDAGDFGIGALTAARGLGALVGPFVARTVIGASEPRLFATIAACAALFGGAYVGFGTMPLIWFALPLVMVAHTGGFALWAMENYGLQRLTRDHLRGRVFTVDFTLTRALMGLSMLGTGYVVTWVDPRVMIVGEATALVVCAAAWMLATRRFWRGGLRRTGNLSPPRGSKSCDGTHRGG